MRRALIALSIAAALIAAPAARAGGWATVGLSSTPEGVAPGEPWNVEITVLQHGRTPLADVTPKVTIRKGAERRTFTGKPTARTGVYRAAVVFPTAGRWTYEVEDGFISGSVHTFPAADIGPASAAPRTSDGGGPTWLAVPGLACLLAAVALLALDRRREPQAA